MIVVRRENSKINRISRQKEIRTKQSDNEKLLGVWFNVKFIVENK